MPPLGFLPNQFWGSQRRLAKIFSNDATGDLLQISFAFPVSFCTLPPPWSSSPNIKVEGHKHGWNSNNARQPPLLTTSPTKHCPLRPAIQGSWWERGFWVRGSRTWGVWYLGCDQSSRLARGRKSGGALGDRCQWLLCHHRPPCPLPTPTVCITHPLPQELLLFAYIFKVLIVRA